MFQNIPGEMRVFRQWVLWRLEKKENGKDTKVPYQLNGRKASVTNPEHWTDFNSVINISFICKDAVEPETPIEVSGYSGIGFVFTAYDPYAPIDLDNLHYDSHKLKLVDYFNSYTEISQSGNGLHIIVRGSIPHGRRRDDVEMYSKERYFAITGNVYQNRFSIEDRQTELTALFEEMGGEAQTFTYEGDGEQKETDEQILEAAANALNGEKFTTLYSGDWGTLGYGSQSEADFALVDILAFYTQNREQIRRLFLNSNLGQRDKAKRKTYVEYMVNKSFDRQLPPVDIDGLRIQLEKMVQSSSAGTKPGGNFPALQDASVEGGPTLSIATKSTETHPPSTLFPPGLLGDIAQYIYKNSPTPTAEISYAAAIGFMAGICGRAYNVSGTGLNQYVLLLAKTGAGKEAMSNGISNIINSVKGSVPTIQEYKGPGEIASAPGLIKCFDKTPSLFSIIGEFGLRLQDMSDRRNANAAGVKRMLLQLFNKSGKGNEFDFTAYSDKTKNVPIITAPSFTIIGESTPESFYGALDETMIKDGLLPRFLIIEYEGRNQYRQENYKPIPVPFALSDDVAKLVAICSSRQGANTVQDVVIEPEAEKLLNEFMRFATDQTNDGDDLFAELWNRAHIKALKLAALVSVGINPINPIITLETATNVTNMIFAEIKKISDRFERNEVGASITGSSETAQARDLVRIIKEYRTKPHSFWRKYLVPKEMYEKGVIPYSAVHRRLAAVASFRLDKMGATTSIKKQFQLLVDSDDLRIIPVAQVQQMFGNRGVAFCVANPERFA